MLEPSPRHPPARIAFVWIPNSRFASATPPGSGRNPETLSVDRRQRAQSAWKRSRSQQDPVTAASDLRIRDVRQSSTRRYPLGTRLSDMPRMLSSVCDRRHTGSTGRPRLAGLNRRPPPLGPEVVIRAAPKTRKPHCSAVFEALCRTRTGDPFLTMAVRPARHSARDQSKRLQRARDGNPQSSAAQRSHRQAALPTGYPAVAARAGLRSARVL
jgi:hypothetical protein